MAWIVVGTIAASTLINAEKAKRMKEQQQENNRKQAEISRYSPWTNMHGQLDNSYVPTMMEAGLEGAVQGVGMAQSLNKAFKPAAPQGNQMTGDDYFAYSNPNRTPGDELFQYSNPFKPR